MIQEGWYRKIVELLLILVQFKYKVVQIWPGQTVTCLHTSSPGHIWTTLYVANKLVTESEEILVHFNMFYFIL
jgi:hypothetical protein